MLPEISFRDEAGFAEMAIQFLEDESLRRAMAAQMQQIVQDQFSYESRWKAFLGHVAECLALARQKVEA
jgi:hypothetical protein